MQNFAIKFTLRKLHDEFPRTQNHCKSTCNAKSFRWQIINSSVAAAFMENALAS
jgi:hypothetical protein